MDGVADAGRIRAGRELAAIGLYLLVALLLFFARALPPDRVLAPADLIFESPFYAKAAPPDFERGSNRMLGDQVYQFIPWRQHAWEALRRGELPTWSSQSQLGKPFLATMQAAVLYPVNLLALALPFKNGFVWSAILRLWLAGVATYFLVRCYAIARLPAAVSATSFALCGFLVVWLGHPHSNVAVLLPAALLCVEVALRAASAPRRRIASLALALVFAAQFLGGHPETILHCLFATALYAAIRTITAHPNERRASLLRSWLPFGALALGATIAAVQLLPFLEWLGLSNEFAQRSARPFVWLDPDVLKHVLTLPLAVFPNLYGNPAWPHPYWSLPLRWGNYNEHVLYAGIVALVFAVVAVVHGRTRHRAETTLWVVVGAVALARALHLPVVDWLNQLPVLGLGWADRLRLVAALAVSVLAGIGVHVLLHECDLGRRPSVTAIRLSAAITAGGAIVFVLGNTVLPGLSGGLAQRGRASAAAEYAIRETHDHPIDFYYRQADATVAGLVAAFRPSNVTMYSSALVALALSILLWFVRERSTPERRRQLTGVGLLLLALIDLQIFGSRYNPVIPAAEFYPRVPGSELLALNPPDDRVLALRRALIPDAGMMLGFSDVRGADYPTRWYSEYIASVPEHSPWLAYGVAFEAVRSPLLRVLGARYVVGGADELTTTPNVRPPEKIGGVFAARVTSAWPRASILYTIVIAPDDAAVLGRLRRHPESVLTTATVTAQDLETAGYRAHDLPAGSGQGVATSLSYTDARSVWRVESDATGLMVVSDSYYPGWQAFVDGVPRPVLRVNHALRAVLVPAGVSTVELRYAPASVRLGALITALGSVALLGLAISMRRTR